MCPKSLKAASTNRTVFSPGGKRGERDLRGCCDCWTTFSGILAELPSERWSSRNRARSPSLAFPHASRKNDFCETFAATVRRDGDDGDSGGAGGRRWSRTKFISQFGRRQKPILRSLKFPVLSSRISHQLPFERIFIHLPSRAVTRKPWKHCKTAGKLCSLTHALYYYFYPWSANQENPAKSRQRQCETSADGNVRRCAGILSGRKEIFPKDSVHDSFQSEVMSSREPHRENDTCQNRVSLSATSVATVEYIIVGISFYRWLVKN